MVGWQERDEFTIIFNYKVGSDRQAGVFKISIEIYFCLFFETFNKFPEFQNC